MKTILVVDDDRLITTTLHMLITTMLKHRVVTSNNPAEALRLPELAEQNIDLVISDFMMPEMNGFEFLLKVKDICPKAVSILLTGYADKENAIRSINEVGIYYYLEKPWDNTGLLKIIRNGLEKAELTESLKCKIIELEQLNETLEEKVAERTASVTRLMDSANQGFLSFGKDMIIHKEYSSECRRIFGREIGGERFSDLILANEPEHKALFEASIRDILDNPETCMHYLPLLPDELACSGLHVHLDYKLMERTNRFFQDEMMVMLTDISEKQLLKNQMEAERKALKMVVKVVTHRNDFVDLVNEYRSFCMDELEEILNGSEPVIAMVHRIFRAIHTFKGSFAMLDMADTSAHLHELESELSERIQVQEAQSDFKAWMLDQPLESWLNEDMAILEETLGSHFLSAESMLAVSKNSFLSIKDKILALEDTEERNLILAELMEMKLKPLKAMLHPFQEYTAKLAERLEKYVYPLVIEGSDIMVDPDLYSPLTKSLVHVFRNAVDHGIEFPDERAAIGKDEYGSIRCLISRLDGQVVIDICDDGRGIDREAVKEAAASIDIAPEGMDDTLLVFHDGLSTREETNELSGRGVGLAAVYEAVKKLNGEISVDSKAGEGTCFRFSIPHSPHSG